MSIGTTPERTTPAGQHWRLPPVLLPDGEKRDLWITDGRLTEVPADGAEVLPGRFALPRLVDAHAHSAISPGFEPLDVAGARDALLRWRDEGVLLVRDLGAPRSVTLEILPDPVLPRLIVAGRWLAPEGRFFAAFHDPVGSGSRVHDAAGPPSQ